MKGKNPESNDPLAKRDILFDTKILWKKVDERRHERSSRNNNKKKMFF